MIKLIKYYFNRLINYICFGKITSKVVVASEGSAWEIEYRGRKDKLIGYWAYGYFDPLLPYHPQRKELSK